MIVNLRRKKGFTLMECLVTVSLFLFIITGIYASVQTAQEQMQVTSVKTEINSNLRNTMLRMVNELRQASTSSISNVPADNNSYNSISFKIPSDVTNATLTWNNNTIVYALSGNVLTRTQNSTTTTIAQNIQTLTFTRLSASPKILEVSLSAQKNTIRGRTLTSTLNFKIELRN